METTTTKTTTSEVIQIREWKRDPLFNRLRGIQEEVLLAKTAKVSGMAAREELMGELLNSSKYSLNGLSRKIMTVCIDSVNAEDLL